MENDTSTQSTSDAAAPGHLVEASSFNDVPFNNSRELAHFLWMLYKRREPPDLSILDGTILATQNAVRLLELDPGERGQLLSDLGLRLKTRSDLTHSPDDLDEAISAFQQAVALSSDDAPGQVERLNELGVALSERYNRLGKLVDLDGAVTALSSMAELIAEDDPCRPRYLGNYGASLQIRYERTGQPKDIEHSIAVLGCAAKHTPEGHPDKHACVNNFGNALLVRFKRNGALDDLAQAISAHQYALALTPDDHPRRASRFNNLGISFLTRFTRTGALEDLEQAVSMRRRAVELTPDDHPEKPSWLTNLGNVLITRFTRFGELVDLELAIANLRRAVELTPNDHPVKQLQFNSLGNSFARRFERTGEPEDLHQSILCHRQAVELTPHDHPDKPSRLNNSGNSLSRYARYTGELEDWKQAISAHRHAVGLTPDNHPRKPLYLDNLCQQLSYRFQHTQDVADIVNAIEAGQRAVELAGHADRYTFHNSLGSCFQTRFDHGGDITDIEKAVSLGQEAAAHISENDPRQSLALDNLGRAQEKLFERTQTQADFDATIETFVKSTLHTAGTPRDRLDSASRCAHLLSEYPTFSSTHSLLSAHSRIISILPEIVWLGYNINRRYEESSQLGELVNAAVSAAVAARQLEWAVEWLETGRALIWAQVLSLRTPLDELQSSHPELARSLRGIQQQLQFSAHNTFAPDIDTFGGIAGLTINTAADDHRKAAIEYGDLLDKIRGCPGFGDFLRPKTLGALISPPQSISGPVVFINVHSSRCDAIILHVGGEITTVPLPELSLERASQLRSLWTKGVAEYRDCVRDMVPSLAQESGLCRHTSRVGDDAGHFVRLLEFTWTWIVSSVLQSLDLANLTHNDSLPHITWCPTGPLTQLPLHAAGIYSDPLGPRTFDFVVSSYTPSLSAFLRCAEGTAKQCPTPSVFVVTQPETPGLSRLPKTLAEGLLLQRVMNEAHIASDVMNHDNATVASVRAAMDQHPWVHLACHGSQNGGDATQSAFHLFDGPLTLSDLMGTVADNAELAFLSACQTAVGDETTPEESAHLAAGMLAVGFKGVIATMWSIQDADAPIVVEPYYKELLALREAGGLGKGGTGAAYALHEATRVLREKVGESNFVRWVPFVHFGV